MALANILSRLRKPVPAEEPIPEKTTVVECGRCQQRLTFVGRVVLLGGQQWCSCGGTFVPIYTWTPEEEEGNEESP